MKNIRKPEGTEHALFYDGYVQLVLPSISVLDQLKRNGKLMVNTIRLLSTEQLMYKYAADKWSIKDLLVHITDAERVFCYRALRFARQDKTPLPFFDENEYAISAQADNMTIGKILKEYDLTRKHTLAFFNHLTAAQLASLGIASNTPTSVRALAWIICGHEVHHMKVMSDRYQIHFN